ncbi:MAG: PAS domain-containing protein [Oscillospiraceae bacterium]|nr:PAS domain-containing protein [Oscillospiraceae bacterium]
MTNQELLSLYIPLVDFIAEMMGPSTEVALNDLSSPTKAVIAIRNGHLSGRKIGAPTTDFALEILHSESYKTRNYVSHYKSTANGKKFVSSSFFIKNPEGQLIGMLCVNTDDAAAQDFLDATRRLLSSIRHSYLSEGTTTDTVLQEGSSTPITTLASSVIARTFERYGVPPERMTREEKMRVVQELAEQGVAGVKGAVAEIAKQLDLSESTVYRYLSQKNRT